jgi:predicted CXXCH cytochrome family protein
MGGFRKPALALLLAFVMVNLGIVLAAGLPWEGKNPVARLDLAAEGVFNANRTGHAGVDGFDGYLRNVGGQSVHQSFLLNTNSCASCHLTHTAPGEKLLFQRSVYNTCTACHFDGTMNTYDILREAGLAGGRFYDGDEPFAFDVSGRSGVSFHLATGLKTTGEAPGADPSLEGWWERPFTCGSCPPRHLQRPPPALQRQRPGR